MFVFSFNPVYVRFSFELSCGLVWKHPSYTFLFT